MSFYKKIFQLLSHSQKRALLILTGLIIIGMLFEMLGLGMMLPAVSLMLKPDIGKSYPAVQPLLNHLGNPKQSTLVFWGMSILVLMYFLKATFLLFLTWKQSRFTAKLSADLSQNLFLGYLRLPYTFHLQRNSAQLLRNIQGEVGIFTGLSQSAIFLSTELSVVFGVAFMLILIEPVGAITITSFLGLFGYAFHKATKKKLIFWGERRQFHAGLTGQYLMQGLGGVKDVKLLGREEYFLDEYSEHNIKYANIITRVTTLGQVPRLYLELLAVSGLAGLIVIMVLQSKPLDQLVPTLGIFVAAAFRMIPSVNRIMASFQNISYSKPVVDVLFNEFNLIRDNEVPVTDHSIAAFKEKIEIKELGFRYPVANSNALNNINITIPKGSAVGFIGHSGSGKSTLVDIILGLLQPSSGQIVVDGLDISTNLRAWQNQLGYVPQSIYLTDDTLRKNVAFGIPQGKINEDAVLNAIHAAQLEEFVSSLPEGLDTMVGERGVRLSGGQRQRIGIARAMYHNPEVLVLDEATRALDTATEQDVMMALKALHGTKTLIIVAHRLSTVEDCDKIYRLKHGKVVLEGAPSEILSNKNLF